MYHHIQNSTLHLGIEASPFQDSIDLFIHILESETAGRPKLLQKPKLIQWCTVGFFWFFALIGTYFRYFLYQYLFQQYKEKKFTPVNTLSIFLVLCQHLEAIAGALTTTLIVLDYGYWDTEDTESWFCSFRWRFASFALYYSFIGSLGVSIHRILLIKQTNWTNFAINEKIMINAILLTGLLLAIFFVIIATSHDYVQFFEETCMMVPKLWILQMLDEYEQSRNNLPIMPYFAKVHIAIGFSMIFAIILEIFIYGIFFHHMYLHNNRKILGDLLEPAVIKRRNRKNAISFFGEFCSFFIQLTVVSLMLMSYTYGSPNNGLHMIAMAFWRMSFAIMSLVEVLLSNILRKRMLNSCDISLYNIIFGLK